MMGSTDETTATRRRYDRIAPLYNSMEWVVEWGLYRDWRAAVWHGVKGQRILEIGTGTGKNMPYYPLGTEVHAIDFSPRMLARAAKQIEEAESEAYLYEMDVQAMGFADNSFDAAVATFVFCSVPDPVRGLTEVHRIVRPGGQVQLLEHMRSNIEGLARIMDFLDPVTLRLLGPHINRRTVENVRAAGLEIAAVEELDPLGVFRRIEARTPG